MNAWAKNSSKFIRSCGERRSKPENIRFSRDVTVLVRRKKTTIDEMNRQALSHSKYKPFSKFVQSSESGGCRGGIGTSNEAVIWGTKSAYVLQANGALP